MERSFGMLKGRFRILLKRIDHELDNICKIVMTCVVLHNMCQVYNEHFDHAWLEGVEPDLDVNVLNNDGGQADGEEIREALAQHFQVH